MVWRESRPAQQPRVSAWPATFGAALRLWSWLGATAAGLLVVVVIGALRRGDFHGIEGFSTTNYGWLAFCITGGIGLAWRLAGRAATWQALARQLVAAAAAFAVCFVAVAVMGLLFIPRQSLAETLTTDSPGRALPVAMVVTTVGYLVEVVRASMRAAKGSRRPGGPDRRLGNLSRRQSVRLPITTPDHHARFRTGRGRSQLVPAGARTGRSPGAKGLARGTLGSREYRQRLEDDAAVC